MKNDLVVQHNQLAYTAAFDRPPFRLWGHGHIILDRIYNAFAPFGIKPSDMKSEAVSQDVAGQAVTVNLGSGGVFRFRFDRIELTFYNFGEQFLAEFPKICSAATEWIQKDGKDIAFSSHKFVYSCHAELRGGRASDWLNLSKRDIRGAGQSRGAGGIFYWSVPEKSWTTQLVVDRSVLVTEGLFVMFIIEVGADSVRFEELLGQGRTYLETVLSEIGLGFPAS